MGQTQKWKTYMDYGGRRSQSADSRIYLFIYFQGHSCLMPYADY